MPTTNDELYVHEHYKFGSKEKELAEFQDHVRRVIDAQNALAAQNADGRPGRVFHTKGHACLAGKLHLLDSRPETTRHGLFGVQGKSSYNVLARFSNGVGFEQHDLKPDVRGLALKVFGVSDSSTSEQEPDSRTIDLVMTNSTNPFGNDQEDFIQFMEASVNPLRTRLIAFLIGHREVARILMKATLRIIPSLVTEQYWSGHPYLLGFHRAMKFNVRPVEGSQTEIDDSLRQEISRRDEAISNDLDAQIKRWFAIRTANEFKVNPNYLSIELRNRLGRGPIRFVFSVQLEKDVLSTPIEDGLVEWKESDSPSIPVAELVLDRELDPSVCRDLKFTPGNYIPEHRPLGNVGRGRVFSYQASQSGRNAAQEEPMERMIFGA